MISEEKNQLLREQKRAYIVATFHHHESDCFFSYEEEEYIDSEDISIQSIDIMINGKWRNGKWLGNRFVEIQGKEYELQEGEIVRIKKGLTFCFQQAIEELLDSSFVLFINHLNDLSFSIYDFIYGYNQRLFDQTGASVYVFDNDEKICTVQHFFERENDYKDRFEFTLSTGERSMITSFQFEE
ncbi:DUF2777 family protein [Bacillus kexueae]|uniref:DUF2777 family protein n=1 Tax=Aeribacillus kexueae TaxID=2078952 RepID=UPI001FAF7614|nr:DUF2777 family protein [Bacillus kexueae]